MSKAPTNISLAEVLPIRERFAAKTELASSGCIHWTGYANNLGYGMVSVGRRRLLATRVAYVLAHGAIPDGHIICHRCDNPRCVNPDHLWAGTFSDNSQDMVRKGRQGAFQGMNAGEANGFAKLSADQVVRIFDAVVAGEPKATIAKRFGVGRTAVSDIATGRRWAIATAARRAGRAMAVSEGEVK